MAAATAAETAASAENATLNASAEEEPQCDAHPDRD